MLVRTVFVNPLTYTIHTCIAAYISLSLYIYIYTYVCTHISWHYLHWCYNVCYCYTLACHLAGYCDCVSFSQPTHVIPCMLKQLTVSSSHTYCKVKLPSNVTHACTAHVCIFTFHSRDYLKLACYTNLTSIESIHVSLTCCTRLSLAAHESYMLHTSLASVVLEHTKFQIFWTCVHNSLITLLSRKVYCR